MRLMTWPVIFACPHPDMSPATTTLGSMRESTQSARPSSLVYSLADTVRHVIGCHVTQETKFTTFKTFNALDVVSGNIC